MAKDPQIATAGGGRPASAKVEVLVPDDPNSALVSAYPGAALVVGTDGSVIAANSNGTGIETLLNHAAVPEIVAQLKNAADDRAVIASTVPLAGAKGEIVLEVTVVPEVADGQHLLLARDLTMERNLRTTLVESRQRYKDLVEISSDFAWELGADGTFVFVSPRGALGFAATQLVGCRPDEFVLNPDDYKPLPFLSDRRLEDVEIWMRRADGSTACVITSCQPLTRPDGSWLGTRGICRDVTEEREREAALTRARHREQLLSYIVGTIRDEVEPNNMLMAAATATARVQAAAGCRIFRQDETGVFKIAADTGDTNGIDGMDDLLATLRGDGKPLRAEVGPWQVLLTTTHYRQSVNGAICIWKQSGLVDWEEDDRILMRDVANQLGIANEQITNHERIVRLSRTDELTGLLNRRAFFDEELPRRLKRLQRSRETGAFFYIDLDNFKWVNDVHGHQRGDAALLFLRDMLIEHSRPGDVIVRLGGDEFAMWLDGIDRDVAANRVETLLASTRDLRQFSGTDDHPLGISVGIAIYDPDADDSPDDLLARADAAMYDAKRAGKGGFAIGKSAGRARGFPVNDTARSETAS
jgi:diguanylate cyclase (GGDEF)-like protein/PAS domain S-box-containing protein